MAKNGKSGDNRRHGSVKNREQVFNPKTKLFVKINTETHKFMDNKTSGGKFKGVRTEK
jgi:hypothetical protein